MTPDKLKQLRELAEKATPGPWFHRFGETATVRDSDGGQIAIMGHLKGPHGLHGRRDENEVEETTRFIAACNPQTVLALLDVAQEAERWRTNTIAWLREQGWFASKLASTIEAGKHLWTKEEIAAIEERAKEYAQVLDIEEEPNADR